MSGTSATSASTGTLGDAPPVSFPGIASGIDYNSIIQKYTAATLAQEAPTKAQINNLNNANTAILKIQNLFGAVQTSLTALSDPNTFNAFAATVGNTASGSPASTASQIPGQSPLPATYTINAQRVATSTVIANNAAAANAPLNGANPLLTSGTGITATNGASGSGSVTINGVKIAYDVTTQTIGTIVANINAAISGGGGSATFNVATQQVSLTGITTLGSGGDSGNLLSVFKLDTAPLVAGNVSSSSAISGVNANANFNAANNAGFQTAVTAGSFTINGVQFTVNPTTDALANVISRINASSAGVYAAFDPTTSSITLSNRTPGPQSILVGSGADTSNFLTAAALTGGSGATTTAGTQASVTYTNGQGVITTAYSSSNDFNNVIQGIDLHVTSSSPAGFPAGATFYTVTVAPDAKKAETAINAFVKAYNASIDELNKDTAAPVTVTTRGSTGTAQNSQGTAGGPLYDNFQVTSLRDQLINLVSGFIPTGSSSYNSLASIGLKLDTASESVGLTDASDDSSSSSTSKTTTNTANNSITVNATSGKLSPLDTTAFETAYAANTAAVSSLFTLVPALSASGSIGTVSAGTPLAGSGVGLSYQLATLLSNADGSPTFLTNQLVAPLA